MPVPKAMSATGIIAYAVINTHFETGGLARPGRKTNVVNVWLLRRRSNEGMTTTYTMIAKRTIIHVSGAQGSELTRLTVYNSKRDGFVDT
jgi:allantoicase